MGYAIITMQGMEAAYQNVFKTSIFDGIELPEGIDKETLVDRIFLRCGEFSVMHSDVEFMHDQILNFFKIHLNTFDRWQQAATSEYNPIENYDRYEDYSGNGDNKGQNQQNGTDNSTDTTTKAAFNSSSYEPYEKSVVSGSSSLGGTNSGDYREAHTSHIHGNIGVTTSVKMLEEHVDFWRDFNIYKAIADLFADEFTIMVY